MLSEALVVEPKGFGADGPGFKSKLWDYGSVLSFL